MALETRRREDRDGAVRPFEVITGPRIADIPHLERWSAADRRAMRVVATVLPFRVNRYVLDHLIDWEDVPDDPIFRLLFPQREMLPPEDFQRLDRALAAGRPREEIQRIAREIRLRLNPHPAGQLDLNVPRLGGRALSGLQHKYPETVLFFPSQGQTCHSYCAFCFRWAQFIGDPSLRMASNELDDLVRYLLVHPEASDVLITGGDPLVMRTRHLERILEALLDPRLEHVQNVRIGTKALTFWPHRFVQDEDADELLELFERVIAAGKHLALMAHYDHAQEMRTPIAHEAIRRLRDAGVVIRSQGPVLRHINDDPDAWAELWRTQVRHGIVPYYMFVERDTGAYEYFELPLAQAHAIFRRAVTSVSGLARTVRGPSMSAAPGKVEVDGTLEVDGERVFVLRFLQARNPAWVGRPFLARYDPRATWLDELRPARCEGGSWFWQEEFEAMRRRARARASEAQTA